MAFEVGQAQQRSREDPCAGDSHRRCRKDPPGAHPIAMQAERDASGDAARRARQAPACPDGALNAHWMIQEIGLSIVRAENQASHDKLYGQGEAHNSGSQSPPAITPGYARGLLMT